MKSSKFKALASIVILTLSLSIANAQDSISTQQPPTKEQLLNAIAMQERLAAMQPDSVAPIYQQTMLSLNYAVTYPQDKQTAPLLEKAEKLVEKLDGMKQADRSDVATLKGFRYICLIVQNPQQNGIRYYKDVMSCLDDALRLNPDNQLAKLLKAKFDEGTKAAM